MTLKTQVEQIVNDANAHGRMPYGENWKIELASIEKKMTDLDDAAGAGLVPGRNIRFSVADGYAQYIVLKVLKTVVHVAHIALLDGYSFSGAYMDSAGNLCLPRQVAQHALQWEDGMKKLFGNR